MTRTCCGIPESQLLATRCAKRCSAARRTDAAGFGGMMSCQLRPIDSPIGMAWV
jgi:hypothetical protein